MQSKNGYHGVCVWPLKGTIRCITTTAGHKPAELPYVIYACFVQHNFCDDVFNMSNRSPYLLKLSQKTRCTILKYFDQEDCPPLTFGLFAKACCFLQRFFRLRKELRLRRNYLLKKSVETLRFCGK